MDEKRDRLLKEQGRLRARAEVSHTQHLLTYSGFPQLSGKSTKHIRPRQSC